MTKRLCAVVLALSCGSPPTPAGDGRVSTPVDAGAVTFDAGAGVADAGPSNGGDTGSTQAPSQVAYASSALSCNVNTFCRIPPPANAGGAATFTVTPALPPGLTLDPSTGEISGIATSGFASTTFTITATNASGSTTTTLTIAVSTCPAGQLMCGNGCIPCSAPTGGTPVCNGAQCGFDCTGELLKSPDGGACLLVASLTSLGTYLDNQELAMRGADVPAYPNGIDQNLYTSGTEIIQCFNSKNYTFHFKPDGGATYDFVRYGAFIRNLTDGGYVTNNGEVGYCDHLGKTTLSYGSNVGVKFSNVQPRGACFDVDMPLASNTLQGRGALVPGGVTLELYFSGQALHTRCADGTPGSGTARRVSTMMPYEGETLQRFVYGP